MSRWRRVWLLVTVVVLALTATAAGSGSTPRGLSLGVNPTRLVLTGRASGAFELTNPTARELVVSVSTVDFAINANGKVVSPRAVPSRSARSWLTVSPGTLTIAPRATATVRVSSHPTAKASPGDHHALVTVTTAPSGSGLVRTRTQIGLPILVRVNGPLVRRLQIVSLRIERSRTRRTLELVVRNDGNINERLLRRTVTVQLRRGGRTLRTLVAPARSILPGGRAVYSLPVPQRLSGPVTAVVGVRPASAAVAGPQAPALAGLSRTFRLNLGPSR
jgi:hypothetical protein